MWKEKGLCVSHGAPTKVGKRPGVAVEVTVELQIELVKKKKRLVVINASTYQGVWWHNWQQGAQSVNEIRLECHGNSIGSEERKVCALPILQGACRVACGGSLLPDHHWHGGQDWAGHPQLGLPQAPQLDLCLQNSCYIPSLLSLCTLPTSPALCQKC